MADCFQSGSGGSNLTVFACCDCTFVVAILSTPSVSVQSAMSALYVTEELLVFKFSVTISTPVGKYLIVFTAVFTRMSKPSVKAIGTQE